MLSASPIVEQLIASPTSRLRDEFRIFGLSSLAFSDFFDFYRLARNRLKLSTSARRWRIKACSFATPCPYSVDRAYSDLPR
jgi:hypothetical protein